MSAIGLAVEGDPARCGDFVGEHAQEFTNVVARYLPMLHRRAIQFLGNLPDAEDAVQDALLSAYKHLGHFRGEAKLSSWLIAIVTNAARMQLRRRRCCYVSLDEPQGEDGLTLLGRLRDSSPNPEEVCSTSEAHERLVNGLKRLSPTLRLAFQLRDIDGLTTREAAQILGVPEATARVRLARARAQLGRIVRASPRKAVRR